MSIPQVTTFNSFNDWRLITNSIASSIGDLATPLYGSFTNLVAAANDLNTKKFDKTTGDNVTGNSTFAGTFGITGATSITGTLGLLGSTSDFTINTNKFNVTASNGNTTIAGTLSVAGSTGLGILSVSGAAAFSVGPTVPTAAVDTNTTQAASTAFVLAQASSTNPLMDGGASFGTGTRFSRDNHIHPTDTTLAPKLRPTFTDYIIINGGTVTVNQPTISITQTWNNASTAFSGIKVNVTNTASAANSLLLDFQLAGAQRFGVDVNGGIVQKITPGVSLARDMQPATGELKHLREYQDLNDGLAGGTQGLDINSISEFNFAYNARWDTGSLTYVKDSALAGEHAMMSRITEAFTQEWWFSDGTTPSSPIAWTKKISFDLPNSTAMLDLTTNIKRDFSIGSSKFNVTASNGNTTILGTLGVTNAVTMSSTLSVTGLITGNLSGNSGTVTNGVYTTGSYADPAWITSLAKSKVGLSLVENTALSTWAGSSNITTLGTIATGTWNATPISIAKGGTGLTAGSANQIPGMNNAAATTEWKSFTSSDGTMTIIHTAGTIDLKTSGVAPGTFTGRGDLILNDTIHGNTFQVLVATGNTTIGNPSTPGSGILNVVGDVNVNTNKFNVTAASGNTTIAGTLSVAGSSTLATASSTAFTATTSLTTPIINNGEVSSSTTITTTTAVTQVPVATVAIATYRSAEFQVQATDTTGSKWHKVSINAIHDGTNINSAEYGGVILGSACATFDFDISGGNLRLLATPSSANSTTFKVYVQATKI